MAIGYAIYMKTLFLFLSINVCTTSDHLRGHNQPLGMQRDPDGHIDTLTSLPTPREFWENYLSKSRPVLIKNAIGSSPAFNLWNDRYLKSNFGKFIFKIEGKTEDQRKPIGSLGLGFDQLSNFLDTYEDRKVYIVSEMPAPMHKDILVPSFMACGSISNRIRESHLWFSSGSTRSRLHSDPIFTLNCLLVGQKNWLFMEPKYSKYLGVESSYGIGGRHCSINVDKVDLYRYPKVGKVPWRFANATSGDCIYLPRGYFHQVSSIGSKNLAYTILFDISKKDFKIFNQTGCDHVESATLSNVPMSLRYPGYGHMTFGNRLQIESANQFLQLFFHGKPEKIDLAVFRKRLKIESRKVRIFQAVIKILEKWIDFSQKYITYQQLLSIPVNVYNEIRTLQELATNPENDLNYEAMVLDYFSVRRIAKVSIESKGYFDQQKFTDKYKKLGGSDYFASKFINTLDEDKDNIIDKNEVQRNLPKALEIYKDILDEEYEQNNSNEADEPEDDRNEDENDSIIDEKDENKLEDEELEQSDDDDNDRLEFNRQRKDGRILDEL
ncbi:Lysine-specific demethylase 8 [Trichoplax sp. H2]|nr:Lysine-specific demethylase 8 [Trichoplax sp. H2]|eukprot:RDD39123.1 Lysine-specific demethylase 8 [Trichoplax sp. H2]